MKIIKKILFAVLYTACLIWCIIGLIKNEPTLYLTGAVGILSLNSFILNERVSELQKEINKQKIK